MDTEESSAEGRVVLKRTIGYFSGVSFIITVILGTGIFISPGAVLLCSQLNVGVALVIWAACGIISMAGALCYAELGTTFPSSGGEYFYIKKGLGPIPAFIFLWTFIVFLRPAMTTVQALMFAEYVIQPFFPGCPTPETIKKATAIAVILAVGIINCLSSKWIILVQNVFMVLKMASLSAIVISGIVHLAMGNTSSFQGAFEGNVPNVSQVAEAFYQGMFAFGGWNVLNYVIEEIKNPSKNIPHSILTAMCAVIVFYLLVNISYLTVLTPKEIVSSAAVSVTWADRTIPSVAWIIPVSVAVSIFGSLNGGMFMLGRLNYAGSKEGHLPSIISMLHVHYLTPAPAMIISTIIASIFVIPSDLISLTNYFSFSSWLLVGLTCVSLVVLRYREPNLERPYKVFLPIAFGVIAVSIFLVLAPIIQSPKVQYFYALLFMFSSVIIYIPFVYFKLKIPYFDKVTCFLQLLLEVSPTDIFEDSKTE
ncbi:b(0,+)-type amino acid transporter 1-like isoform X1 [Ranitomeya imitator]|uniref:b(0,+)-type amino acid transporter 1-like isoform X1 n=1 Tax=Ranitomeya imitator TaxID=111125 RepID=UPI0037E91948